MNIHHMYSSKKSFKDLKKIALAKALFFFFIYRKTFITH